MALSRLALLGLAALRGLALLLRLLALALLLIAASEFERRHAADQLVADPVAAFVLLDVDVFAHDEQQAPLGQPFIQLFSALAPQRGIYPLGRLVAAIVLAAIVVSQRQIRDRVAIRRKAYFDVVAQAGQTNEFHNPFLEKLPLRGEFAQIIRAFHCAGVVGDAGLVPDEQKLLDRAGNCARAALVLGACRLRDTDRAPELILCQTGPGTQPFGRYPVDFTINSDFHFVA
ncbi:hypothetical protein D3C87_1357470 [compost metagenome]